MKFVKCLAVLKFWSNVKFA